MSWVEVDGARWRWVKMGGGGWSWVDVGARLIVYEHSSY